MEKKFEIGTRVLVRIPANKRDRYPCTIRTEEIGEVRRHDEENGTVIVGLPRDTIAEYYEDCVFDVFFEIGDVVRRVVESEISDEHPSLSNNKEVIVCGYPESLSGEDLMPVIRDGRIIYCNVREFELVRKAPTIKTVWFKERIEGGYYLMMDETPVGTTLFQEVGRCM